MPKTSLRKRVKTRESWKAGRRCSTNSSRARSRAFFFLRTGDGCRSLCLSAFESQTEPILPNPPHARAVPERPSLSQGRGQVDVPLLAARALDGLPLGRKAHRPPHLRLVI